MSTPPGRLPSTPGGQSPRQTQKQQTAGGLTVGTIRRNNVPMVRFLDTYNTSVEIPISVLRQLPEIFGQEFENDAVEESTPDNLHRLLRPSHPAVGATGSYKGKEKRKRGPSNDAQGEDEDEDNGRKPAKKRQAKGLSSSDTDSREAHLETLYKRNGYWRSKNKDKPFLKKWMTQPNMTLEEIRMIRRNYDIIENRSPTDNTPFTNFQDGTKKIELTRAELARWDAYRLSHNRKKQAVWLPKRVGDYGYKEAIKWGNRYQIKKLDAKYKAARLLNPQLPDYSYTDVESDFSDVPDARDFQPAASKKTNKRNGAKGGRKSTAAKEDEEMKNLETHDRILTARERERERIKQEGLPQPSLERIAFMINQIWNESTESKSPLMRSIMEAACLVLSGILELDGPDHMNAEGSWDADVAALQKLQQPSIQMMIQEICLTKIGCFREGGDGSDIDQAEQSGEEASDDETSSALPDWESFAMTTIIAEIRDGPVWEKFCDMMNDYDLLDDEGDWEGRVRDLSPEVQSAIRRFLESVKPGSFVAWHWNQDENKDLVPIDATQAQIIESILREPTHTFANNQAALAEIQALLRTRAPAQISDTGEFRGDAGSLSQDVLWELRRIIAYVKSTQSEPFFFENAMKDSTSGDESSSDDSNGDSVMQDVMASKRHQPNHRQQLHQSQRSTQYHPRYTESGGSSDEEEDDLDLIDTYADSSISEDSSDDEENFRINAILGENTKTSNGKTTIFYLIDWEANWEDSWEPAYRVGVEAQLQWEMRKRSENTRRTARKQQLLEKGPASTKIFQNKRQRNTKNVWW